MAESNNSMERPDKPQTGTELELGYDEKFWNWTRAIETMSITFRNELLARINKLGGGSGGGSGSAYNGYFKLTASGTNVTIHDSLEGDYASATNAGRAQINNAPFTVLKNTVTATGNGFIYLRATISAGVIQAPTLVFSSSYTYTAGEFKLVLGRVAFAGGSVTSITQEHHGLAYGWIYTENIT